MRSRIHINSKTDCSWSEGERGKRSCVRIDALRFHVRDYTAIIGIEISDRLLMMMTTAHFETEDSIRIEFDLNLDRVQCIYIEGYIYIRGKEIRQNLAFL